MAGDNNVLKISLRINVIVVRVGINYQFRCKMIEKILNSYEIILK